MESDEGTENTSLMVDLDKGNDERRSKVEVAVRRRMQIENKSGEHTLNLVIVVEDIRMAYYLTLFSILILGIIITKTTVKEDYSAIIKDVFGASNVCVYLDFPPVTYVMPILWCFAVIFGCLYAAVASLRIYVAYLENKLTRASTITLMVAYVYVAFSILLFTEIFSVQPDREKPETMIIHSFAYLNIKIMLAILQVVVTYFGIKVSWKGLKLPRWFSWFSIVLAVSLILVSAYSLVFAINALGDMGEKNLVGKGLMWSVKSKASILSGEIIVNGLGTVLGLVLPLIQAIIISRHGVNSHSLVIAIGDNRSHNW